MPLRKYPITFALLCLLAVFCFVFIVPHNAHALADITPPSSFYDGDQSETKTIGSLTVGTNLTASANAQSVTNGQTGVSLAAFNVVSLGAGQTNTITLAAPGSSGIGKVAVIAVSADATNVLAIADSGTAALSSAFAGGASDTLTLIAVSTGVWAQVSTSNN